MDSVHDRNDVFAAMAGGKPYKTYKKTILGQVFVHVWDPFSNNAAGMILKGDPRKNDPDCYIEVWSEGEDQFFKRKNYRHFQNSSIVPVDGRYENVVIQSEPVTDEALLEVLNSKFLAIQNYLNKVDSVDTLFRLISLAKDAEKSEKIIGAIEARISEIQSGKVEESVVEE